MAKQSNNDTAIQNYDPVTAGAITRATPEAMAAYIARGVTFTKRVKLEAGAMFEAVYLGAGEVVEFQDDATGEVKYQVSHRFKMADGIAIEVLGAFQLDGKLGITCADKGASPALSESAPVLARTLNKRVLVVREPDVNVGKGHRMTPYHVEPLE